MKPRAPHTGRGIFSARKIILFACKGKFIFIFAAFHPPRNTGGIQAARQKTINK